MQQGKVTNKIQHLVLVQADRGSSASVHKADQVSITVHRWQRYEELRVDRFLIARPPHQSLAANSQLNLK